MPRQSNSSAPKARRGNVVAPDGLGRSLRLEVAVIIAWLWSVLETMLRFGRPGSSILNERSGESSGFAESLSELLDNVERKRFGSLPAERGATDAPPALALRSAVFARYRRR